MIRPRCLPWPEGGGPSPELETLESIRIFGRDAAGKIRLGVALEFSDPQALPAAGKILEPILPVLLKDVPATLLPIFRGGEIVAEDGVLKYELLLSAGPFGLLLKECEKDMAQSGVSGDGEPGPPPADPQLEKIRAVMIMCVMYADEHGGLMPDSLSVLADEKMLPRTRVEVCGFVCLGRGVNRDRLDAPSRFPVPTGRGGRAGEALVGYADGSVKAAESGTL